MEHHMQLHNQYKKLGLELLIEGIIMFFVMYAMVDIAERIYFNTNMLYMTIMMAAPMGAVMLYSMRSMYQNKKLNLILYIVFALLFFGSFYATRTQAFVGNEQFLRAMIPHHSGAMLMCQEAKITDPEIKTLCSNIIQSQKQEISRMEAILKRY
jgi:uncharacterized protein (DUF305 family)